MRACLLLLAVAACGRDAQPALSRNRIEDRHRLVTIARLVAASGSVPMRDGMFDPYELVRRGSAGIDLFQSARFGFGPTLEEAKAGDYAAFPWERCKGPRKLGGRPFPLLWEKEPDADGRMLALRSDGIVAVWDPVTLLRAVAEGPVER
jgi:hypothetical protein